MVLTNRSFKSLLNKISDKKKKLIDLDKVNLLTNEEKHAMVNFIIRNRGPVLVDLFPDGYNISQLAGMGYLYTKTASNGFQFLCNGDNYNSIR